MTGSEFSNQFDVLYNNITSNQAPGLNEYEKSVFLTKAQDEIVKNYFLPQSNPKQAGFDGNQKRQMDFSMLMEVANVQAAVGSLFSLDSEEGKLDPRAVEASWPSRIFLIVNETLSFKEAKTGKTPTDILYKTFFQRQVIALDYAEYTRLMSKPYKEPLKNQAWRLLVSQGDSDTKVVDIIAGHNDLRWLTSTPTWGTQREMRYNLRYVRKPKPIIVVPIDSYGVTIEGFNGRPDEEDPDNPNNGYYELSEDGLSVENPCELDESVHEEILQRAVELAKIAWAGTQEELAATQLNMTSGQRSE